MLKSLFTVVAAVILTASLGVAQTATTAGGPDRG